MKSKKILSVFLMLIVLPFSFGLQHFFIHVSHAQQIYSKEIQDIFDQRYLNWLQRISPDTDPNNLNIRQRYTDETGLGALKTDSRNSNIPRFQQNLPYGNDGLINGVPLNFPVPGFYNPPSGSGNESPPSTPSTPPSSPPAQPGDPFGAPPPASEAPSAPPSAPASVFGISVTANNVATTISAVSTIASLANPAFGIIGFGINVGIGWSQSPNTGYQGFKDGLSFAVDNSVLGIAINAITSLFSTQPVSEPGIRGNAEENAQEAAVSDEAGTSGEGTSGNAAGPGDAGSAGSAGDE